MKIRGQDDGEGKGENAIGASTQSGAAHPVCHMMEHAQIHGTEVNVGFFLMLLS